MEGPTPNPVQQDNFSNFTRQDNRKSSILFPMILVVVVLLVGLGAVGWYFMKSAGKVPEGKVTQVPTEEFSLPTNTPIPTTSTEDKSGVKIEILNGSGIPGEAAYAKSELQKLGYSDITTGNAPSGGDKSTTTIVFSSGISQSLSGEITSAFTDLYQTVTTKTGTPEAKDIQITVGLRKGQSATSAPTKSVSPATTPKLSITPTISSGNTITPTKTPTP